VLSDLRNSISIDRDLVVETVETVETVEVPGTTALPKKFTPTIVQLSRGPGGIGYG
jgi:hypothetical protein